MWGRLLFRLVKLDYFLMTSHPNNQPYSVQVVTSCTYSPKYQQCLNICLYLQYKYKRCDYVRIARSTQACDEDINHNQIFQLILHLSGHYPYPYNFRLYLPYKYHITKKSSPVNSGVTKPLQLVSVISVLRLTHTQSIL